MNVLSENEKSNVIFLGIHCFYKCVYMIFWSKYFEKEPISITQRLFLLFYPPVFASVSL